MPNKEITLGLAGALALEALTGGRAARATANPDTSSLEPDRKIVRPIEEVLGDSQAPYVSDKNGKTYIHLPQLNRQPSGPVRFEPDRQETRNLEAYTVIPLEKTISTAEEEADLRSVIAQIDQENPGKGIKEWGDWDIVFELGYRPLENGQREISGLAESSPDSLYGQTIRRLADYLIPGVDFGEDIHQNAQGKLEVAVYAVVSDPNGVDFDGVLVRQGGKLAINANGEVIYLNYSGDPKTEVVLADVDSKMLETFTTYGLNLGLKPGDKVLLERDKATTQAKVIGGAKNAKGEPTALILEDSIPADKLPPTQAAPMLEAKRAPGNPTGGSAWEKAGVSKEVYVAAVAEALKVLPDTLLARTQLAENDPNRLVFNYDRNGYVDTKGRVWRPGMSKGNQDIEAGFVKEVDRLDVPELKTSIRIELDPEAKRNFGKWYRQMTFTPYFKDALLPWIQRNHLEDRFRGKVIDIDIVPNFAVNYDKSINDRSFLQTYVTSNGKVGIALGYEQHGNHIMGRIYIGDWPNSTDDQYADLYSQEVAAILMIAQNGVFTDPPAATLTSMPNGSKIARDLVYDASKSKIISIVEISDRVAGK